MAELTEAGLEARRKYHREYKREKSEQRKASQIRYWNKKGEEIEEEKTDKE